MKNVKSSEFLSWTEFPFYNVENGLYLLALLLAGAIRLSSLGAADLSDAEANLALQALGIARGAAAAPLEPHPLYLILTSVGMFLFGDSNFIARFWPALAGSLLVLAPWYFRRHLGRMPALLLAFFLAIDPGMVAISRQAGSPILALAGVLFAVGLWMTGRSREAGVCAGLALLGGPAVWQGILGLALAGWAFSLLLGREKRPPQSETAGASMDDQVSDSALDGAEEDPQEPPELSFRADLRMAGLFALGTVLFGGSFFLWVPAGWSAAAQSLVAYAQSWYLPSGMGGIHLLQALLFYGFLPVTAGVASALVDWQSHVVRFLAVWGIAALFVALSAPGHQVSDLAWVLPPLWALTGLLAVRLFARPVEERLPVLGQALLGAVILGFISLSAIGMSSNYVSGQSLAADGVALVAALVLLLLTTLLVGWGWTWRVAGYGLVWSFALILMLYTLMSTWSASGLAGRREVELWASGPTIRDGDLIRQTIEEVSLWKTGTRDRLDIVVEGVSSPALQWILRGQENIRFIPSLAASASPAFVITPDSEQPDLSAGYRGQDFVLQEAPTWDTAGPQGWFRWLVFREMATQIRPVILWARSDLFPGGQVEIQSSSDPLPTAPEQPLE